MDAETKILRRHRNLIRRAGGDDFAVLALRIEHPVPYARLGDNDLCTPTHELSNTVFGERRNLLPIRIIDMIPIAIIIDVGYLPLLCSSR